MTQLVPMVTGRGPKGAIRAPPSASRMQLVALAVSWAGASTSTLATAPSGANVTSACPRPAGAPVSSQRATSVDQSARRAARASKGGADTRSASKAYAVVNVNPSREGADGLSGADVWTRPSGECVAGRAWQPRKRSAVAKAEISERTTWSPPSRGCRRTRRRARRPADRRCISRPRPGGRTGCPRRPSMRGHPG